MTHILHMAWGPKDASDIRKDVIVFDGDCVLCSRMAATVHRADPQRVFSLTDMNAPVGQALAKRFGVDPENPETVIVIRSGRQLFKTDAAFAIARTLPGWRWLAWLRFFPRWLRDLPYDIIARNRYRWFGRKKSCALADPALRAHCLRPRRAQVNARRILLVGGAGVFGSRLARGLVGTTDAEVVIAGRDLAKAQAAAKETGASSAVALDRSTATPAQIAALAPALVIDAAGPFQGSSLSFARACIAANVDYIDLADARDFVADFSSLDAEAKAAGVRAITGASSTPAITHAALDDLTAGWTRIDSIHAGISPGNRAPRGPSVVKAILSWVGAPVRVFENGAWRTRPGWSGTTRHALPELGRRRFALTETPDLDLILQRFHPREDAVFTAGLELALLHTGVGMVGAIRHAGIVRDFRPMAGVLQKLAALLNPFGSDRGGMFVEALGRDADNRPVRAEWTLVSPRVVGPYVPTLPALVTARKLLANEPIAPGARACVGLLWLSALADDFKRHGFLTGIVRENLTGPFEMALGDDFTKLPPAVRAAHTHGPVSRFTGSARVTGASGPAWIAARLFGFPHSAEAAPVTVKKHLLGPGYDIWDRTIGASHFRSEIRYAGAGRVTEKFGPFTFTLAVAVENDRLVMAIKGWRMGWLPLPAILAPRSAATEAAAEDGSFLFDVPISVPLLGRLTHYKGSLTLHGPDEPAP